MNPHPNAKGNFTMSLIRPRLQGFLRQMQPARLALLAGLCAAPLLAHAEVPHQDQLPGNSMLMLAIPDTAQWWAKAESLPVVQGLTQFLASQEMAQDLEYQQFLLEKQKLGQRLGFPATMDELMGNVLQNMVLYATPAAAGGEPEMTLLATAKDSTKAKSMLAALDQINQERQAAEAATTSSLGTATTAFEKVTIGTVEASQLAMTEPGEPTMTVVYGLAKDLLVVASSRAGFEQAIAQGDSSEGMAANADFTRLRGKLPWDTADAVGYFDGDALLKGGNAQAAMLSSIPGLSQNNRVAFTLGMGPAGLEAHTASTANPTAMTPNIQPRPMEALPLIANQAMVGIDYALVDSQQLLQSFQQMMGLAGAPADSNPFAAFEQATGISVQNELVPAVGQEVVFAINNLQQNPMSPMVPMIDLVIGLQVKDEAQMRNVLTKLETFLQSRVPPPMVMQPDAQGQPPAAPTFTDKPMAGVTARTLDVGLYGLSPSYALNKGYAVISLTASGLEAALTRMGGQQTSIVGTPAFTQVAAKGTESIYSYSLVDLSRIVQGIITPYAPMLMAQNPQDAALFGQVTTLVLSRFGAASATERLDGDLTMGHAVIGMK